MAAGALRFRHRFGGSRSRNRNAAVGSTIPGQVPAAERGPGIVREETG
jgi:hypothetical protein